MWRYQVLRLAFRYLDLDNDGELSPKVCHSVAEENVMDLVAHLLVEDASQIADMESDAWCACVVT
eukprot:3670827-Amphidinium_carterae.1